MADTVLVSRSALLDLIEDVKAIARVTGPDGSMVYCRLMKKVHAVEITMTDGYPSMEADLDAFAEAEGKYGSDSEQFEQRS